MKSKWTNQRTNSCWLAGWLVGWLPHMRHKYNNHVIYNYGTENHLLRHCCFHLATPYFHLRFLPCCRIKDFRRKELFLDRHTARHQQLELKP